MRRESREDVSEERRLILCGIVQSSPRLQTSSSRQRLDCESAKWTAVGEVHAWGIASGGTVIR